ncbi:MAG: hypothetical protein ACI87E_003321 [Mariniblastus sp.]|jgi:hypothetical protein
MKGYSYFSKRLDVCQPITTPDTKVYLWSFQRGKNVGYAQGAAAWAAERSANYIAAKTPGRLLKKDFWLPPHKDESTVVK